jgi:hypothetical protein
MLVEKFVDSPRHIEIQVSLFSESTTILLINYVPNVSLCVLAAGIRIVRFLLVIVVKNTAFLFLF